MSALKLCRICLRSDNVTAKAIDERLSDFYDELCDVNVFANPMFTFCPLCEWKLRKFYNFKQKCLRSNHLLKRKIAGVDHMDLTSWLKLIPRDSIGFSMPSDRAGFFQYKYNDDPLTYLNSTSTENNQITLTNGISTLLCPEGILIFQEPPPPIYLDAPSQCPLIYSGSSTAPLKDSNTHKEVLSPMLRTYALTETDKPDRITSEFDASNDEEMIDLIKTEVDKLLEDPITVNKDDFIKNVKEDECAEIDEFKEETIDEDDSNKIDNLDDDDNIEYNEEYISDDENALSENINTDDLFDTDFDIEEFLSDDEQISKPIKEVSCKKDLNSIKTETIKTKKTNSKKVTGTKNKERITMKQLELLQRDSFDLNDFNLDELKCIKGLLSAPDKKYINSRLKFEEFKNSVVDLLEQGKIDLGEVKITKDMFLEMVAKCDISGYQRLGITMRKRGPNISEIKEFLLFLHKKFNPDYETVFKIEYLNTREKKLAEFNSRKDSEEYIKATFKCKLCFLPFLHKSKLEYHNIWHDPNRAHACEFCPMRFTRLKTLKNHRRTHNTVYRCKLCPVSTNYFTGMVNHYNQHKGRLYTCDICLGQYESYSTLNGHRLSHTRFTCELCGRKYLSQSLLDKHKELKHANDKTGADEATLSCDHCDAVFKTYTHMRRHMQKHEGLFYKCLFTSCYERFATAFELREHARSSGHVRRPKEHGRRNHRSTDSMPSGTRRKPFQDEPYRICPVCGEQVVNKTGTSLYMHHKRHHPSEPYQLDSGYTVLCEHCGKAFMHHTVYLDHLNTHTGVKPYECKECGARFSHRYRLSLHSKTHGARCYQCKDCDKKYKSAANLFTHTRTHIGDRKFKCTVCDKGFLHSGSLKEHIKGVHNNIRRRRVRKQADE